MRIHLYIMKLEIISSENEKICISTDFTLLTITEHLQTEKGKQYLDYWLDLENLFTTIHLPIWILTKDDIHIIKDFLDTYPTALHIGQVVDDTLFKNLDCVRQKFVFGKSYTILDPAIYLFYQNKIVFKSIRTHKKAIGEAYLKGLDIQYKNFIENFRKKLTSKKEFVSIRKR